MRRWLAAVAIAAGVASSVAACGASSSGALSASAAKNLHQLVERVRLAASSGSYSELQQAIDLLKSQVRREEQSGDISSQRANDILNAADILLQDASPSPRPSPTPTVPPTTTTVPSPTPSLSSPASSSPTPSPSSTGSGSPLLKVSPPV